MSERHLHDVDNSRRRCLDHRGFSLKNLEHVLDTRESFFGVVGFNHASSLTKLGSHGVLFCTPAMASASYAVARLASARFRAVDLEMATRAGLTVYEHALVSGDELTCEGERRIAISQYRDRREDVAVRLHLTDVVAVPDLRHHDVAGHRLP